LERLHELDAEHLVYDSAKPGRGQRPCPGPRPATLGYARGRARPTRPPSPARSGVGVRSTHRLVTMTRKVPGNASRVRRPNAYPTPPAGAPPEAATHGQTPCFRLAAMKSSRSPSSTACVFPTS
jgi:hypothetical protein